MEKFDLSVILPLKSSSHPWFEDYFNKAITSIKTQEVEINELVIVHTDETKLVEFLDGYDFSGINVTREVWTKKPGFAEQVNHGARIAKSKWISIFEFDDEYSKIWFKNVDKYSKIYKDTDCFLLGRPLFLPVFILAFLFIFKFTESVAVICFFFLPIFLLTFLYNKDSPRIPVIKTEFLELER